MSLGVRCGGHCTSPLQDPAPTQSICSHVGSDAVREGKEEIGKLRQRIISKGKFMVQENFSILTAQGPWQGAWVSQPAGACLQQCKRHRARATRCGAGVLGDVCFWQGYEPAQEMQLCSGPF